MIAKPIHRARQFVTDPVLRRWLARRLLGDQPPPPAFAPHRPPYLADTSSSAAEKPAPPRPFRRLQAAPPRRPIALPLPGLTLELGPGDERGLFERAFDDIESLLALHRFAWLPLIADGPDKESWLEALWAAWRERFAAPSAHWAWHPYTAAERVCNLLDFAEGHGLPGAIEDTTAVLAGHAAAIRERLEYFGQHDTSNHLANNGRGLYRLGLAIGLPGAADVGARILLNEAERIFRPSGVLGEGSSHYHLLLARNYADAWLAARHHKRPEEEALARIAARALAVVPSLTLPGGLPLIGDVSPDCPPEFLAGLHNGGAVGGWIAGLDEDQRTAMRSLAVSAASPAPDDLAADGWLRFDSGPWSGLWHRAPDGWPPMPGHAHQDLGSFELHLEGLPVIVDPGRGRYGETGDAALYRSGRVHSTLLVDDCDPYPANKPYYDDSFRASIIAAPPAFHVDGDEVMLVHHGFRRLGGVGALTRRWRFSSRGMSIEDRLDGRGRRKIARMFVTPLAVEAMPGGVLLTGGGRTLWLSAVGETTIRLRTVTLWHAYGAGRPGHLIEFSGNAALPWTGRVTLQIS